MRELRIAYDSLVEKHEFRLQEVANLKSTSDPLIGYAIHDFFSQEPFYHEINNIPKSQAQFYFDADDFSGRHNIYICTLVNSKLVYIRNSYGGETYYDSFFTYDNNESWRLELYSNNEGKKPVKVERLLKNESGQYESFESYSEHGYQKTTYRYTKESVKVDSSYYDLKQKHLMDQTLEVFITESTGSVEKIFKLTNDDYTVIYNKKIADASLEELLNEAQNKIVNTILTSLKKKNIIEEEIDCILLEYNMQNPFPPTVGLDSISTLEADQNPLEYYCANDMKHFSEVNFEIDFYNEDQALYDAVNSKFSTLYDQVSDSDEKSENKSYDKIARIAFDAYLDICRNLKKEKSILEKFFPISNSFHVVARDYEQYNQMDFLRILLTKKEIVKIERLIELHELESALNEKDQVLFDHLNKTLVEEADKYEKLKLKNKQTVSYYSIEQLYFLKPYGFERHHNIANDNKLKESKLVKIKPEASNYHEYYMDKDELAGIAFYRDEKLSVEHFYLRTKKSTTEWIFKYYQSGLELSSFSILQHSDSKPDKLEIFSYSHIETCEYKNNDNGDVYHCKKTDCMISKEFINVSESEYAYSYDDQARLTRITRRYDKGRQSDVVYSSDDSFMLENINAVVTKCHAEIMTEITQYNIKNALAIVLEINKEMIFPLYHFYIVFKGMENRLHWEEIRLSPGDVADDNTYLSFLVYTSRDSSSNSEHYFNANQALEYINLTLKKLTEKLHGSIKSNYNCDVKVLVKSLLESTDKIEKILLD